MQKHLIYAFGVFVSCHVVAAVSANDEITGTFWPQFRGPDRNGVSRSTGLVATWPDEGPKLVWRAEGVGRGYSSVSIADGRIFTMGDNIPMADDEDEYLVCFDLFDGKPLWKTHLGPPWNRGSSNWQGSRSTPTVDEDRVYALTAHGDLVCARVDSGAELWRRNLREDFDGKKGDTWGYSESVLVDGDRVVCTPGGPVSTMVALDKGTGDLIWSALRESDKGAGHASIVKSNVAAMSIYVQTTASGALGVRARDGQLMWSYGIDRTTAVIPTPIVRGDLVFFTAGYKLGGALLRQVPNEHGTVDVQEIYPPTLSLQNKHGGVVLVGDQIYGDSDASGSPFCADLLSGQRRWTGRGSGQGSASLTVADGHLYIRFKNAVMAMAKATPDGYEEVGSFKIPGGGKRPSWSHPVVAGGRLYLREGNELLCYELRENQQ